MVLQIEARGLEVHALIEVVTDRALAHLDREEAVSAAERHGEEAILLALGVESHALPIDRRVAVHQRPPAGSDVDVVRREGDVGVVAEAGVAVHFPGPFRGCSGHWRGGEVLRGELRGFGVRRPSLDLLEQGAAVTGLAGAQQCDGLVVLRRLAQ